LDAVIIGRVLKIKAIRRSPWHKKCSRPGKAGPKAVNLPEEKGSPFPQQHLSVSPACAALFPLFSFSLPILSGAFQMNSLLMLRVRRKRQCGNKKTPQSAGSLQ
jgi:hypothetical protein